VVSALVACWSWLIGRDHWRNVTARELQGYVLWVPTALAIAAVEILGALGWQSIPWTTISTTVGHLETRWHVFAVIVVVLITLVVFLGFAYTPPAPATESLISQTSFSLAALTYDICVIVAAIGAGLVAYSVGEPKLVRGYWIYGIFLIFGVVGPSVYAVVAHAEPTVFATIRSLGARLPWFNLGLVAGMAVLSFHLAIYPWPDIAHQSTTIAGVNSDRAKQVAEKQFGSPRGYFESVDRGSVGANEAWIVTLYPSDQQGSSCVVVVVSASRVTDLQTCALSP
jgi:hypothetical protein